RVLANDRSPSSNGRSAADGRGPANGGDAELQSMASGAIELARTNKRPDAIVTLLGALPDRAMPPGIVYDAANSLRGLGRPVEAHAAYERVIAAGAVDALKVDSYKALADLARQDRRQRRPVARDLLMRARALQPREASVLRALGNLAFEQHDWAEAVRWDRE